MIIETERLILREMTLDDAAFLYKLMNSENWLKYIGDRGINSVEAARAYMLKSYLGSYQMNGFGAYMMVRKTDGELIGNCGLYKREKLKHPDIGFAMLPEFYKMGYGYEAAMGVLKYAKENLNIDTVLAITDKENRSSIGLLNKIGLNQKDVIKLDKAGPDLLLFSN
tara:strand:+ start:73529 stop:74029 length:501 start_codon:yes stop_codon:yes gene_type:complete